MENKIELKKGKTITLYASENSVKGTEYEITIDYDTKRLLEVIEITSGGKKEIYGLFNSDEEVEKKFTEIIKQAKF